jgi:hypothetical protein
MTINEMKSVIKDIKNRLKAEKDPIKIKKIRGRIHYLKMMLKQMEEK